VLEQDGFFAGIFTFLRQAPQQTVYRLEAVSKKRSFFDDNNNPEREMLALSAQLGWEYVVRYGMFYIYRSTESHPRELHTDPAVQAMALEAVRKQQRSSLILSVVLVCSWFFLRTYGFRYLFRNAVTVSVLYTAAYLLFILWLLLDPIRVLWQLHTYRKRLLAGDALTRKTDWKRRSARHILYRILPVFLALLIILCPLSILVRTGERIPLVEYTADPPFITIADMIPGGSYENPGYTMGDYNTLLQWSTTLSPVNIEWDEQAKVTGTNGAVCSGVLHVDYHETLTPWLAEGLFRDYYDYEANRYHGKRFWDWDAPPVPVDDIRVFASYGVLHILLRQSNIVLHATLILADEARNDLWERWTILAAQHLAKGGNP